ncbi:MAG: hypothetical protein J5482_03780 [Oscillospiraceae bacterium]|nr:hypothetical protein [Oscillospiraceae bacterium]
MIPACAGLGRVAGTQWSNKENMNGKRLKAMDGVPLAADVIRRGRKLICA